MIFAFLSTLFYSWVSVKKDALNMDNSVFATKYLIHEMLKIIIFSTNMNNKIGFIATLACLLLTESYLFFDFFLGSGLSAYYNISTRTYFKFLMFARYGIFLAISVDFVITYQFSSNSTSTIYLSFIIWGF
jgi:hypothetical protein